MYMKKHIKGGASEKSIDIEDGEGAKISGPYIPLAQDDQEEVSSVIEEGQPVEEEESSLIVGSTLPPPEVESSQRNSSSLLVESQPKPDSQDKSSGQNKMPILQSEDIIFSSNISKTPTPVSSSSSLITEDKLVVPTPPPRVPTPLPRVPTPPPRVPTPPPRIPTPPPRVPTPNMIQPITIDDRKTMIDIARLYVDPIKIDGRTPSRENDELYNFGLNLFEHNKSLAQTFDQFICLRPEQIIYKNTKTKKVNRLYTSNNRTVKKHLKDEHGLQLKTRIDLKDNLFPLQAQKCAIPPTVSPQINIQQPIAPPPMPIQPIIPPVNVDVAGLKRNILSGIGELLDRLITNETMRGGRYRRNKRGTVRSYRNKRRVSRKHKKASKGRRTRRS